MTGAKENRSRCVELGEVSGYGAQPRGKTVPDHKAVLGDLRRRQNQLLERLLTVILDGESERRHFTGNTARERASLTEIRVALAAAQGDPEALNRREEVAGRMVPKQINEARRAVESFALRAPEPGAGWGCFAAVNRHECAVRQTDEHETTAADAGVMRVHNAQRQTDCDRRINRIAAGLQHVESRVRREGVARGDHAP